MARNRQKFDVNGEELTVLKAHGPLDLARCLGEIQKPVEPLKDEDPVAKFQKSPNYFLSHLPFFKSKATGKSAEKSNSMQAVLYTNGPHQRSLIVTNGVDHYFYDLVKGAAASFDVKEVLGPNFTDVSRDESRINLEAARMDVAKAREMSARHLPNLQEAVSYAMQQIKAAQQKAAEQQQKQAGPETKRAGFGSSAAG